MWVETYTRKRSCHACQRRCASCPAPGAGVLSNSQHIIDTYPLGGTHMVYMFHLFHMIRPRSGRILFLGRIIDNANLAVI
jgi:hypothetical protein